MQLKQNLEAMNINSYAVDLLQTLCEGTLAVLDAEDIDEHRKKTPLNNLIKILTQLKQFNTEKTILVRSKEFLTAEGINSSNKYALDMGAALNVIIAAYDRQDALKVDLEKGVDFVLSYLKEYDHHLDEKSKENRIAASNSKRKVGVFIEKQNMPYLRAPSSTTKSKPEQQKIATSKSYKSTPS